MATQSQSKSSVINDLITINNDRCEGYKTAADEAKESDLKSLFLELSSQSEKFGLELRRFADSSAPATTETKNTGKVYRMWMDLKAAVTGNDRKAILGSCEFGEDVAKSHYEEALKNPSNLTGEALNVVRRQQQEILKSHDKIKSMRDALA